MDGPIDAFIKAARGYCALIEDNAEPNSWMFARECLISLLHLYDAALHLPQVEPTTEAVLADMTHESWDPIRRKISLRFQRDYYWQVFEPPESDPPEVVGGSLSDDLADIWRDIKPGLEAMRASAHEVDPNVIWDWRFSFETHWAQHAAGAINAHNALCFGQFADPSRPTNT